jgi:hypothetical protein
MTLRGAQASAGIALRGVQTSPQARSPRVRHNVVIRIPNGFPLSSLNGLKSGIIEMKILENLHPISVKSVERFMWCL